MTFNNTNEIIKILDQILEKLEQSNKFVDCYQGSGVGEPNWYYIGGQYQGKKFRAKFLTLQHKLLKADKKELRNPQDIKNYVIKMAQKA